MPLLCSPDLNLVAQLHTKIFTGHQQMYEIVQKNKVLIERLAISGRKATRNQAVFDPLSLLKTDRCLHFHVSEPLIICEQREWLTLLSHQKRIHSTRERFRDIDGKMDTHVQEVRGVDTICYISSQPLIEIF